MWAEFFSHCDSHCEKIVRKLWVEMNTPIINLTHPLFSQIIDIHLKLNWFEIWWAKKINAYLLLFLIATENSNCGSFMNFDSFCWVHHSLNIVFHARFRAGLVLFLSTWTFHRPPRYPWWTYMDIWLTTHPPPLVHVVIEWPPRCLRYRLVK